MKRLIIWLLVKLIKKGLYREYLSKLSDMGDNELNLNRSIILKKNESKDKECGC